eukprot:scaffold64902_cov15-Tisochrysis_lutea.AAC.1
MPYLLGCFALHRLCQIDKGQQLAVWPPIHACSQRSKRTTFRQSSVIRQGSEGTAACMRATSSWSGHTRSQWPTEWTALGQSDLRQSSFNRQYLTDVHKGQQLGEGPPIHTCNHCCTDWC